MNKTEMLMLPGMLLKACDFRRTWLKSILAGFLIPAICFGIAFAPHGYNKNLPMPVLPFLFLHGFIYFGIPAAIGSLIIVATTSIAKIWKKKATKSSALIVLSLVLAYYGPAFANTALTPTLDMYFGFWYRISVCSLWLSIPGVLGAICCLLASCYIQRRKVQLEQTMH